GLLCAHGRDRSLLEDPTRRKKGFLHRHQRSVSSRCGHIELCESAQDLSQFQEQHDRVAKASGWWRNVVEDTAADRSRLAGGFFIPAVRKAGALRRRV